MLKRHNCYNNLNRFNIKPKNLASRPKPQAPLVIHELRFFSSKRESKAGELIIETGKLNPNYVRGFTDGEGSFIVSLRRTSRLNIGYSVELSFRIKQHLSNKNILTNIKNFFEVGVIG